MTYTNSHTKLITSVIIIRHFDLSVYFGLIPQDYWLESKSMDSSSSREVSDNFSNQRVQTRTQRPTVYALFVDVQPTMKDSNRCWFPNYSDRRAKTVLFYTALLQLVTLLPSFVQAPLYRRLTVIYMQTVLVYFHRTLLRQRSAKL